MYARQITSEETYTLQEARRIINAERKAKRESLLYKLKQKLLNVTNTKTKLIKQLQLKKHNLLKNLQALRLKLLKKEQRNSYGTKN